MFSLRIIVFVAPYLEIQYYAFWICMCIYIYMFMSLRYESPICSYYSSILHYVLSGDPLFGIFLQTWEAGLGDAFHPVRPWHSEETIAPGNRYKDQTPRVQIVNPYCSAETTQIRCENKVYTEYIYQPPANAAGLCWAGVRSIQSILVMSYTDIMYIYIHTFDLGKKEDHPEICIKNGTTGWLLVLVEDFLCNGQVRQDAGGRPRASHPTIGALPWGNSMLGCA